jgi:hypothetical protein
MNYHFQYTDWQIMVMGIETWLTLGAQKIVSLL